MTAQIESFLNEISTLPGFVASALGNGETGETMGMLGEDRFAVEVAVAANAQMVRAKYTALKALGMTTDMEDIVVTLPTQYHLISPIPNYNLAFVYVVLERAQADLERTRAKLCELHATLQL